MNIKPVRDFIAVVKEDAQKRTSSGIYVPNVIESNVLTGKVVAVGSGHLNSDGRVTALEVQPGDRVMFGRQSAIELTVDDQAVLLLREEGIVCKLTS